MKLTCDREMLLAALGLVAGVVPTRSPKPVLQSVKLAADADGVAAGTATLIGTDLELGIRRVVPGCVADRPGAVLLPPARLAAILRSAADATLAIEAEGGTVTVRGRSARFTLPSEDPDLFPAPPAALDGPALEVDPDALRRAIRRTATCTDPTSTRYALAGVLLEPGDGTLTLVGTDGRRLATQSVAAAAAAGSPGMPEGLAPVVPARALRLVEKALADGDAPATVVLAASGPGAVLVRCSRAAIWSRLVEGRFPDWRKVLPASHASRATFVGPGELADAVEAARVTTSKESRGVDLAFAGGVLRLSSRTADVGESAVELPCELAGPDQALTLDGSYLAEMLGTLADDVPLALELGGPKAPVVLRAEDGFLGVVMPLSRD